MKPAALTLSLLAASSPLLAEEVAELDPLEITASRTRTDWLTTPVAVSAVETANRPGEQGLTLDTQLAQVPGTYVQSRYNFAQGMRIAIRGFGARSSFGVRGVRVLVDGVPLTMPDGQTEMDGVDTALVESLEVIRGPAASSYGNAAGGVLAIRTREPGETPFSQVDVSAGGLGYHRVRAETSGSVDNLGGLLAFNSTQLDGYRDHGRAEANSFTGKLAWQAEAGRLGLSLSALDNRSEDPGALTRAEVRADRSQARVQSLRFNSDERIRQQRLALTWEGQAAGDDSYLLRSWVGSRQFGNRLPLQNNGQTRYDRLFSGLGAQYTHHAEWFGLPQRLTGGLDLEAQRDDRDRHNNLDGRTGALTLEQREQARSQGLFLEDAIQLGERWQATLGLRRDSVKLEVDDRFLSNGDDSSARTYSDWNRSLGLSYRLDAHHVLYARYATSFETPTANELANPAGGGFNPALGPAQATNREVGLKGEWNDLRYEAALYRIDLDDELVPYGSGITYYANAGKSRRDGLELSLDWRLDPHWRLAAAYSYNDYRFIEFKSGNADYGDNAIPGIPRQSLFAEVAYEWDGGYARLNSVTQDRLYAENANNVRVGGYTLVNARLGTRLEWNGQALEPYLGIDNLFGRDYYDNIRINDGNARYFEPGPGRVIYAGASLSF